MLYRWAQAQCELEPLEPTGENLQEVLKACVHFIKYDTFTPEEFAEYVVDTGVISPAESLRILKCLVMQR